MSRPGTAWHRCLRDCSGEFIRACLAGEASVHLSARVVPLILRGVYPEDCCALWQAWRVLYLCQVWWSAQAGRKGRHELCSSQPRKPPTNHPARPLMQKFFRCAEQIATPCGARYPSWGEARRKGGKSEPKVHKHAACCDGSGTQGAVAHSQRGAGAATGNALGTGQ